MLEIRTLKTEECIKTEEAAKDIHGCPHFSLSLSSLYAPVCSGDCCTFLRCICLPLLALGLLNFAVKVPLYLQEKEIYPHREG